MKELKKINISGASVYPIIEGGKGIGVSNGVTAGAFAAAGAVGTFSGVFPPIFDETGNASFYNITGKTRRARSEEVIQNGILAAINEAKEAFRLSNGKGRIHMNVLWGIAGAERILNEVLEKTTGMIHGITCGAGMPYKLSEIAKKFEVYYYPIVSSSRAFSALWSRSYKNTIEWLGGIVYEDPWKAGGHNGLTNKEKIDVPEDAYKRVSELRRSMNQVGLNEVPIIMAGGVWNLSPFEHWIDNPEIGPIAFQFGTRPLLTQESPISDNWKNKLLDIKENDVTINRFSSTGFYSSAVKNNFLNELIERSQNQIPFKVAPEDDFIIPLLYNKNRPIVYVRYDDKKNAEKWVDSGLDKAMETPDSTLLFVQEEKYNLIKKDQRDCKGCLAACKFSSWCESEEHNFTTGKVPDPRSFCIQKSLVNIICTDNIEENLLFSGHNTHKFSEDKLYLNGHIPTIEELVSQIIVGK